MYAIRSYYEGLLTTFNGKDGLGDVTGQIIGDYDVNNNVEACSSSTAPGYKGIRVKIAQGVLNYEKGQLFIEKLPGDRQDPGCIEFLETFIVNEGGEEVVVASPQPAFYSITVYYNIMGGTGEYEGAVGTSYNFV